MRRFFAVRNVLGGVLPNNHASPGCWMRNRYVRGEGVLFLGYRKVHVIWRSAGTVDKRRGILIISRCVMGHAPFVRFYGQGKGNGNIAAGEQTDIFLRLPGVSPSLDLILCAPSLRAEKMTEV